MNAENFNHIAKGISIIMKQLVLYPEDHPILLKSVDVLLNNFKEWFQTEERFDLESAKGELLLNGLPAPPVSRVFYRELLREMQIKGIISIAINKNASKDEIISMVRYLEMDPKKLSSPAEIVKNLPVLENIKIKLINYAAILSEAQTEDLASEEKMLLDTFTAIAEESKKGPLDAPKYEFMAYFLNDTKKATILLNKIFKNALIDKNRKGEINNFKNAIARAYKYFDQYAESDKQKMKKGLVDIIAGLDPRFVVHLFEESLIDDVNFDMAAEITKDFSDDNISEFIESLISGQNTIDENFLKVFDRLTKAPGKAESIGSIVGSKISQKKFSEPGNFMKLKDSVKAIFRAHPSSNFMSSVYKMTIEALVDVKADNLPGAKKLSMLVKDFKETMTESNLRKKRVKLVINILKLESDNKQICKMTSFLGSIIHEVLDPLDFEILKDIVDYYTSEMILFEMGKDLDVNKCVGDFLSLITEQKIVNNIVELIPEASSKDIGNIINILVKTKAKAIGMLLDRFTAERDNLIRYKYGTVIAGLRGGADDLIMQRLNNVDPANVRGLLRILRECSPEKVNESIKKLLMRNNTAISSEAVEEYVLNGESDIQFAIEAFRREKNQDVAKKLLRILIKARDKYAVDAVYKILSEGKSKSGLMLYFIEVCGMLKVAEAEGVLSLIFNKRSLFPNKAVEEMRVQSLIALGRLGTSSSKQFIEKGLRDRMKRIIKMSEIILKMDGMHDGRENTKG